MGNICSSSESRKNRRNTTIKANRTDRFNSSQNRDEIKSVTSRNYEAKNPPYKILDEISDNQKRILNKTEVENNSEKASNKNKKQTNAYNNKNNSNRNSKSKQDNFSSRECEINNNDKNSTFVVNTEECKKSSVKSNTKVTIENKKTLENNDICSNRYNFEEQNNKDLYESEKLNTDNNKESKTSFKEKENNLSKKNPEIISEEKNLKEKENDLSNNLVNSYQNINNFNANEIIKQNTLINNNNKFEDDSVSNIQFIRELNNNIICNDEISNIADRENIKKNNDEVLEKNNNYFSYKYIKGDLFNLAKKNIFPTSENSENDNLYYFSEFHFTTKGNYSSAKDFNSLLDSPIYQNKIILANKLLNLHERQWYKEAILLSDSLKSNRENTYLDSGAFNQYLNRIIKLYNHFNWLVWALSYYYCNSLLFNKNHWFNAKNSNLPNYDNLDWVRGFEWKGLFIRVQTYDDSKNLMKEIKALKYAFLDYIQIIDSFKSNNNVSMNSYKLLSNEIIFPFISYTYFGGTILYVSAAIKKFYYEEKENMLNDFGVKRENVGNTHTNSNTKSNTQNLFDFGDDISEVILNNNYNKNKNEQIDKKKFLDFKEDYISLNENNLVNNDINLSNYSYIDLECSNILSKINENNLVKVMDDISVDSNINSQKYKFLLVNVYSLLPDLFNNSEIFNEDQKNYIKFQKNQSPKIYEIPNTEKNEIERLKKLLDEPINNENDIKIYQNKFQGIDYRIIFQNKNEKNEKVTNYFVKLPLIQNRELSSLIINQYFKESNVNFIMHKFQLKNTQDISDNNVILFKTCLQIKMKYSLISKYNEPFNKNFFNAYIDKLSKNILSYKIEMRNSDNLKHFCERFGLNTIFLPFLVNKVENKNIKNIIKIFIFSKFIKKFFCYNQGQNLLLKLAVYESSKDKELLNSTSQNDKENNMVEIQRKILVNCIKFFLLPSHYIAKSLISDLTKKLFLDSFMENLSFIVFMYALKIRNFEKFLNITEKSDFTKMTTKEIIQDYAITCRNNPFLFIDTLEKIINFRMSPYFKYKASLDVQNLNNLKKEDLVIFAPKVNCFMDVSAISGYILAKNISNANMNNNLATTLNNSISQNLLQSSNVAGVQSKIGKVDSITMNNFQKDKNNINNNNVSKLFKYNDNIPENEIDEDCTLTNNNHLDSSLLFQKTIKVNNNNPGFLATNNFINDINDNANKKNLKPHIINKMNTCIVNSNNLNNTNNLNSRNKTSPIKNNVTIDKNQKLSLKNVLNRLIIDNFIPANIYKNNTNISNDSLVNTSKNSYFKYLYNNYTISGEEVIVEYSNNIERILGDIISYNGITELVLFKNNLFKIFKYIFFKKDIRSAKELLYVLKNNFKQQYLFTFSQCSLLAFIEALTQEKFLDNEEFYSKALVFSLFNLGDVRCNNCNGHQYMLLPLYMLCKITGYAENPDTNEYFKEMFRCLVYKISEKLKVKELNEKIRKLVFFDFPSVSDLKKKTNDFFNDGDFLVFLMNSVLNFIYEGDNYFVDNDYISYNKINFKITEIKKGINFDTPWLDKDKNKDNINKKNEKKKFIYEELLDKLSYLKYGPSNILISFGKNNFNQTSHDGYEKLTLPRLVYKLSNVKVKKIFSGYEYNFIIDNKNNIYSWGCNSQGQCGIEDKKFIKSPTKIYITQLANDDYIENIFCGNHTTYLLSNKKFIFLCGYNIILKENWRYPRKLDLFLDSNIKQISSGENFTLFLTEKGNVYSMGIGTEGQLGINNINNLFNNEILAQKPLKIENLNDIKLISTGEKHCFALSEKNIFCWGKSEHGQLGLNFCEETRGGEKNKCKICIPERMQENLMDEIEIKNIICGKDFSFFLTKNDEILACGNNDKEQLGIQENNEKQNKNTKMCNDYIIPTEVEQFSLLKVIKLVCGEAHCIAIIKDTISNIINVWCWGNNNFGQLGLGSHIEQSKPKPNHYILEFVNHKAKDISVGRNHSIVLLKRKEYNEDNNDDVLSELIFKYSKI